MNRKNRLADNAEASRAAIVEEAARQFARCGYGGTSLRQIAAPLGITAAAINYHFPHKQDLGLAVVEPYLDAADELTAAQPVATSRHRRRSILAAYLELLRNHAVAARIVITDPAVQRTAGIETRLANQVGKLLRALAGPNAGAAATVRAAAALGAIAAPIAAGMPQDDHLDQELLHAAERALTPK